MQAGDAPPAFVAALHLLLHAPQLAHYALSDCPEADLQRKRQNACGLVEAFCALARDFWGDFGGSQSAQTCWLAFRKVAKAGVARSDSVHDLAMALLAHMHAGLAKTEPLSDSLALRRVRADVWHAHNAQNGYSFLAETFQAQLGTATWDLQSRSETFEHPWSLSVAVDGCSTLQTALARKLEPLTAHAEGVVTATKRYTWLPCVLIVDIQRASDRFVDYPAELDASAYAEPRTSGRDRDDSRYALCAVVCAAPDGRHVVLATPGGQEPWSVFAPGERKPLPHVNDVIQKNAEVLLYRLLL